MILLKAGALVLGLAVVGLLFLMDREEDLGRVSQGWVRNRRREEER